MVKEPVRKVWTQQLRETAGDKSTLKRCYLPSLQIESTHPVLDSVQPNGLDVMRAAVKGRILTGTYLFQFQKMKYNIDGVKEATSQIT